MPQCLCLFPLLHKEEEKIQPDVFCELSMIQESKTFPATQTLKASRVQKKTHRCHLNHSCPSGTLLSTPSLKVFSVEFLHLR